LIESLTSALTSPGRRGSLPESPQPLLSAKRPNIAAPSAQERILMCGPNLFRIQYREHEGRRVLAGAAQKAEQPDPVRLGLEPREGFAGLSIESKREIRFAPAVLRYLPDAGRDQLDVENVLL